MEFRVPLWKHQRDTYELAKELPEFALFGDPGTGKTATAIALLRNQVNQRRCRLRTLIFAPPRVLSNWRAELLMHSKFEEAEMHILEGSGDRRVKLFRTAAWAKGASQDQAQHRKPGIVITNYESLSMDSLFDLFKWWAPEAIIFDESHRLKSHTSKRAKLAYALANPKNAQGTPLKAPYKLILTGTPVLNSPLDLFQQFLILDGGKTFGEKYFHFLGRYFRDRNAGMPSQRHFPKWEVMTLAKDGFDALAAISERMAPKSIRIKKEECMDLPPLIKQLVRVPMAPKQAMLYKEMERDLITFYDSDAVSASMAMIKSLRLLQIASGFVKTDQGEEHYFEKTPKMEALQELLENLLPHGKVLIWAVFKANFRQISKVCTALNIDFAEVHGDISSRQQADNILRFQTSDSCRALIGHPGSGGIGINLIQAPYSIFVSRGFSLEHSIQAEARNHRGGSEIHEKIVRYDLVCEGTIDELVGEALSQKEEISHVVFSQMIRKLREKK